MAIAMGWQKPDNVAGTSAPAIMVGLFVASGGLLFGYDTGSISGILEMDHFKQQFSTSVDSQQRPVLLQSQSALIVAILSAGTVFGALLSAPVADLIGRRYALIVASIVFSLGAVFQVCAEAIPMLLVGRFFAGVGVGAVSLLVPLYQSEMAPRWIRGTLVCAYQLSITLGLLGASIVNMLTHTMQSAASYRIPMGLQLTWSCILAIGLLVLPETPRYLIKRGRKDAAALSLSRLRRLDITHPALIEELAEIEANHEWEVSLGPDTYRNVINGRPHIGRRTLTGCILQVLQQLTGINFIMYYGVNYFKKAEVTDPFLIGLVINIINMTSTLPGLLVIESWGRRKLLIVGAAGMAASQFIIAILSTVAGSQQDLSNVMSKILIIFVSIYIFFFAASWGPVTWVVTSEIYPLKVRAKCMSASTSSNWLLNFIIAYSTPFLVGGGEVQESGSANLGGKIFFIWGAFCIVAIFFVYFMVYETSKLSLEQIDELYERVAFAWHSKRFEPAWSFQQMRDHGYSPSGIPPPDHELQQTTTATTIGTTTAASINTTQSSAPSTAVGTPPGTADSSDDKLLAQMGTVDFSY